MYHSDMLHLFRLITYPRALIAQVKFTVNSREVCSSDREVYIVNEYSTDDIILMSVVIKDNKITDKWSDDITIGIESSPIAIGDATVSVLTDLLRGSITEKNSCNKFYKISFCIT